MTKLKTLLIGAAASALAIASFAGIGHATTVLVADTGWQNGDVTARNKDVVGGPIVFTVGAGQTDVFSLTDAFLPGDHFKVTINGSTSAFSSLTLYPTSFPNNTGPFAAFYAPAWQDPQYEHLQLTFGAGSYSLKIVDLTTGAQFYPAGFGYRLDSGVPEPATWALMLGGIGMIGFAARRRNRAAATA